MALAPTIDEIPDKILNMTLNFHKGTSINNIKFKYPELPLYHDKSTWGLTTCPEIIPFEESVSNHKIFFNFYRE
jgi:hypothetical protein